jgi:hypothetical protein
MSKRGWVLQERLLATHTLHFTSHGVISDDPSGTVSEDGRIWSEPSSRISSIFRDLLTLPKLETTSTSSNIYQEAELSHQRYAYPTPLDWLDLVDQYSRCDLTREEDKLVAIAGMAEKIRSRTGARWCAGLWSESISEGLLWLSGQDMSRQITSRASSWSWAAWDGPIQYPEM